LGDDRRYADPSLRQVDEAERLLRRLALNDEESVGRVLGGTATFAPEPRLGVKMDLLVRLGALLSLGAATTSLRSTVERARAAGASEAEIVDVLVAIGPAIGLARVVSQAPRLAHALGYDIDAE
jgi:Carboxymuconolactone decarboxylase family